MRLFILCMASVPYNNYVNKDELLLGFQKLNDLCSHSTGKIIVNICY